MLFGLLGVLGCALVAADDDPPIIHDIHYPDLNTDGSKVAFSYQGDIWVADLHDGKGIAKRLTVNSAYDSRPRFSPDGSKIAFNSDRYGGDVFTVPSEGGTIERVTYHSANDSVADWSPDGTKLLFSSGGRDHRYTCPYEIELASAYVHPVFRDSTGVSASAYSPDGRYITGIRGGMEWWRKGYKGSAAARIYVYDTQTDTMKIVSDYPGMNNWPCFSADGRELYYVSEREGRPNVFAQDIESGRVRALTHVTDDATYFLRLSGDRKTLIFEWNFDLWTLDVRGGQPRKLEIRAPEDSRENFEGEETVTANPDEMEINRDGTWAALRLRDDVFLVKTDFKNGSIRVTDWPGMDGDFFWHPNGQDLYYISQQEPASGLWVYNVETKQKKKLVGDDKYYIHSVGFTWDASKYLFRHNAGGDGVFAANPETGEVTQFLSEADIVDVDISPDGLWIAACINHPRSGPDVYVRKTDGGDWVNITNQAEGNFTPRWSPDGKRLFLISRRTRASQIWCLDLTRQPVKFDDYDAQFAAEAKKKKEAEDKKKQAEEKKAKEAPPGDKKPEGEAKPAEAQPKPEGEAKPAEAQPKPEEKPAEPPKPAEPAWKRKAIEPIQVDLTDADKRVRRVSTSNVDESIVGFAGDRLIYTRGQQIWSMNFDGEEQRQLVPGDFAFGNVRLTDDGSSVFFVGNGKLYKADAKRGGPPAEITFKAQIDRDARTLQKWAFRQAWGLLDESFYSWDLHGTDWNKVYEHYAPYCTGTLAPEDFAHLASRMIGELNGSHLGCYAGGHGGKDTGRLGYIADPTYKGPGIKVGEVLARSPVDQPDATVKVGEYILAIDGKDVDNTEKVYQLLEGKAGERVKLLVNDKPSKDGAREISAKPISGGELGNLWYDLWVDQNRQMAKTLSNGRVYYIHMNGMNAGTLRNLEEELRGSAQHYDAVIIDVRFNGGGYTHDSVLELLTRKMHGWNAIRGVPLRTSPGGQFDGPMCCLTNENSFSDAEIFPNGFREKHLGKLIGMPTAGGVIGTWDTTLVNGAGFRVPVVGWYTAEGVCLENYGVPPDIQVPYPYDAYHTGKDPQIEAGVKELLAELETKAPAKPPQLPGHPAEPFK